MNAQEVLALAAAHAKAVEDLRIAKEWGCSSFQLAYYAEKIAAVRALLVNL
jgi:hypothetical protein